MDNHLKNITLHVDVVRKKLFKFNRKKFIFLRCYGDDQSKSLHYRYSSENF